MFFVRIRRHAKWVFVFLALTFAVTFVVFGVGANNAGTGIGDILSGSGSDGVPSISDALDRIEENPKDADARRDLATAYQADGRNSEAIAALDAYIVLRPKDQDALRELAGLHLTDANLRQQEAENAQIRAAYLSAGSTFVEPLKLGNDGATLGEDPITTAITTEANEAINAALESAQTSYTDAVQTYEQLVKVVPRDPNVQLELAQTAEAGTGLSEGDRRLSAVPEACSRRLERGDRQGSDQAAPGGSATVAVRLDSPASDNFVHN